MPTVGIRLGDIMNWAAYFQIDGEFRHTIGIFRLQHRAELEIERFIARITHPRVGVWFTWSEETNEEITEHRETPDTL